jgi:chemotaxis protein methyltransferase CheR
MVHFEVASIVGADPACGGGPFDLIFCRNLLIYFEREAVPQILEGLAENLRPGGALVLSPADAVLPLPAVLRRGKMVGWLHPTSEVFASVSKPMPMHFPSVRVRAATEGIPVPAIQETPIERAARLFGSGQGSEAEAILAELLNREPDHIAGWFLLGEALLQRGERSQARVAFTRASRCSPKLSGGVDGEALQRAATRRAFALDG